MSACKSRYIAVYVLKSKHNTLAELVVIVATFVALYQCQFTGSFFLPIFQRTCKQIVFQEQNQSRKYL